MTSQKNPNLEILIMAAGQLEELTEELVFLGGCATGLLITDPAAPPIRATLDVDVIVQVTSLSDYHRLSERLRLKGFSEDMRQGAPICRWINESIVLDVMPTDEKILGFGNKWYLPAIENFQWIDLRSGIRIKMVSSPYFLITKLEAFDGRGNGDYMGSHDMEDIIAVLDGRISIINEVKESEIELKKELKNRFSNLLKKRAFLESLPGHLPSDESSQIRLSKLEGVIKALTELKE